MILQHALVFAPFDHFRARSGLSLLGYYAISLTSRFSLTNATERSYRSLSTGLEFVTFCKSKCRQVALFNTKHVQTCQRFTLALIQQGTHTLAEDFCCKNVPLFCHSIVLAASIRPSMSSFDKTYNLADALVSAYSTWLRLTFLIVNLAVPHGSRHLYTALTIRAIGYIPKHSMDKHAG